ncbi:hypothetical protein SLA2020_015140 [Shorea laevis]
MHLCQLGSHSNVVLQQDRRNLKPKLVCHPLVQTGKFTTLDCQEKYADSAASIKEIIVLDGATESETNPAADIAKHYEGLRGSRVMLPGVPIAIAANDGRSRSIRIHALALKPCSRSLRSLHSLANHKEGQIPASVQSLPGKPIQVQICGVALLQNVLVRCMGVRLWLHCPQQVILNRHCIILQVYLRMVCA